MAGDSRVSAPIVAADFYTEEGTDQKLLEFGQSRDC